MARLRMIREVIEQHAPPESLPKRGAAAVREGGGSADAGAIATRWTQDELEQRSRGPH
jgi:hypothetical protein